MKELEVFDSWDLSLLNCSAYVLLNGYLSYFDSLNNFKNVSLSYPYVLITNCSDFDSANISYYYNLVQDNYLSQFVRDAFPNGFISISFVLSGITVASWSLVLLLLFASAIKSKFTGFLILFHAITVLVLLKKTTELLDKQFHYNYQDADLFDTQVIHDRLSVSFIIIIKALVIVAWAEIVLYVVSKARLVRAVKIISGILFVANVIFNSLNFTYHGARNFVTNVVYTIDLITYVLFTLCMYTYVYRKRNFGFLKDTVGITLFSGVLLLCPILFYLVYVISDRIDNWAPLMHDFFPVLISIVSWELIVKLQKKEQAHESRTILGRAVSNDDFSGDVGDQFSSWEVKNPIMKNWYRKRLKVFGNNRNSDPQETSILLHNLTEIHLSTPVARESESSSPAYLESQMKYALLRNLEQGKHAKKKSKLNNHQENLDIQSDNNIHSDNGKSNIDPGSPLPVGESTASPADDDDNDKPPKFEIHPNFNLHDYYDEKSPQ